MASPIMIGTEIRDFICMTINHGVAIMFDIDWDKPDAVNESGVKFWLDKSATDYAQKADQFGTKLKGWQVLMLEEPNGHRTRIVVNEKQEIMGENQSLEGIGCQIDVFKLLKRQK